MDLEQALAAHSHWKNRLSMYLAGEIEGDWDPALIERDDACSLGRWIGEVADRYTGDEAFADLRSWHSKFHASAAKVMRLAKAGQRQAAEQLLAADGDFGQDSARVVECIRVLQRAQSGP